MRTAVIEFEEYPDEEVVVQIAPVPVAAFFDISEKANKLRYDPTEFAALSEAFAPFLVSWTFDAALEVFAFDFNLGVGIIREWAEAVRNVPLPLPVRPSDGTPSEAGSPDPSPEPDSLSGS